MKGDDMPWPITAALVVVATIVGLIAGGRNEMRYAIEAGVAEWRINPKTGESTFHYLTPETSDDQ